MNYFSFDDDICIVVQGPLTYTDQIIKIYEPFKKNIIISTNDKSENSENSLSKLFYKKFTIVLSDLAEYPGKSNLNNQVKTTLEGIKKAEKLGFKYVLKIRSDIVIEDLITFINLLDKNLVYFPAYYTNDGGYLCDYMVFGSVEFMLKLWDIPLSNEDLPPEIFITKKFEKIRENYEINYIFPILYEFNIAAYWLKYNKLLNNNIYNKLFTYEKYKKGNL